MDSYELGIIKQVRNQLHDPGSDVFEVALSLGCYKSTVIEVLEMIGRRFRWMQIRPGTGLFGAASHVYPSKQAAYAQPVFRAVDLELAAVSLWEHCEVNAVILV